MSEIQPSQNKTKIYFLGEEIHDITIHFNNYARLISWNCRKMWEEKGYTRVRIFYDCNGLHVAGEGMVNGEVFIPQTSISTFTVIHLPGHEFEK